MGLAFISVNFDPLAPVEAILAASTIAPFDDAGGHISPHEGYHYQVSAAAGIQILNGVRGEAGSATTQLAD